MQNSLDMNENEKKNLTAYGEKLDRKVRDKENEVARIQEELLGEVFESWLVLVPKMAKFSAKTLKTSSPMPPATRKRSLYPNRIRSSQRNAHQNGFFETKHQAT